MNQLVRTIKMDYLDMVTEGVQVSRQELGSGQYRWTVTFLDEGDDFELEDVVSRNYLNTTTGDATEITTTKVPKFSGDLALEHDSNGFIYVQ